MSRVRLGERANPGKQVLLKLKMKHFFFFFKNDLHLDWTENCSVFEYFNPCVYNIEARTIEASCMLAHVVILKS